MSIHIVDIVDDRNAATVQDFLRTSDKAQMLRGLSRLLDSYDSGAHQGAINVRTGAAKASGTFTFSSVIATDVLTVNGIDFTCVASGASDEEFNVGGDDTESAANAAAAINASTEAIVTDNVVATSSGAVVTITARYAGTMGNCITIADSDSTITTSGARLTGGSDGTETNFDIGTTD